MLINSRVARCLLLAATLTVIAAVPLAAQDAVRWSDSEALANATQRAEPTYPPLARQAKVVGVVKLDVVIDEEGAVEKATAVSGNPLLVNSAISAVKQWKFTPANISGRPVKVTTTLGFTFKL